MPTPKPGQIRCPTCQQPTPAAAYCTQCGAPLPSSLQARPRGMDRAELEERVRHRRPGDPAMRRGRSAGDDLPPAGYVPFQPEPEDANALRAEGGADPVPHVDNTQPGFDEQPPPLPPAYRAPDEHAAAAAAGYAAASADQPPPPAYQPGPVPDQPDADPAEPQGPPRAAATYGEAPIDEAPYGAPEDAYPYAYPADDGGSRGGSSALPIIGFILLGVLALGVGAVLASLLGGGAGVGEASPTQTPVISVAPSEVPSTGPSEPVSEPPSSTPEPTDGPITFPDGARLSIQPCASNDYDVDAVGHPEEDACNAPNDAFRDGEVWVFIVFNAPDGSDPLTVQLLENDSVQDEQELTIDSVLGGCDSPCIGLIYGAHYVDLFSGDYQLILLRDGEFADSATFGVEG
jgi:hypothetical protein